jgi:hypothetical protein
MQINFTNNYAFELNDIIESLESRAKGTPTEDLIMQVQEITDAYVEQTGKRPKASQLDRLADVILTADLTDPNPHKMKHNDAPTMSDRQLTRRLEREWSQNDWNMDTKTPVVGFKVTHFTDDNGVPQRTRQPIYGMEGS